jgi:iron-sulfur cluster assembly protein
LRLVLDEPKENDDKYEFDGLTYLIDKELSTQSGDVKVDFVDNGWQQGFVLSTAHPLGSGGSCGSTSCSC